MGNRTICEVQYYKPDCEAFAGNKYSYYTSLPLKVGDEVLAPTQTGKNRAIVKAAGRAELNERELAFADRIKEITEYYKEEGED